MNFNDFTEKLSRIIDKPNSYLILDDKHPLMVFFGRNGAGQLSLLFSDVGNAFDKSIIKSTFQIDIAIGVQNGKKSLIFSLCDEQSRDIFIALCYDLIESSRKISRDIALQALVRRFASWREMLRGGKPGELSEMALRGLLAELLALREFCGKMNPREAVESWIGPIGADRDFEFSDTWAEIKCCKASATSVKISSLEQLDNERYGTLDVYFIEPASDQQKAFSLSSLIKELNSIFDDAVSRIKFNMLLMRTGYAKSDDDIKNRKYALINRAVYEVNRDFPVITRNQVSSQIVSCSYEIDLPSITDFLRG